MLAHTDAAAVALENDAVAAALPLLEDITVTDPDLTSEPEARAEIDGDDDTEGEPVGGCEYRERVAVSVSDPDFVDDDDFVNDDEPVMVDVRVTEAVSVIVDVVEIEGVRVSLPVPVPESVKDVVIEDDCGCDEPKR